MSGSLLLPAATPRSSRLCPTGWPGLAAGLVVLLGLAGCPQPPPGETPPPATEFCAASGVVENDEYRGVICLAPVDPIAHGSSGGGYILQPGPIRFVLPLEPSQ